MRRFFTSWFLAIVAGVSALAQPMDDNHQLTQLWKKYEEARKADRPQTEAEILAKIRQEAIEKHLPLDFYDAATAYVNTVKRRDWKQQDQLLSNLEQEVKDFGEPIVTFRWMREWAHASAEAQWRFVQENPDGLSGNHPAFHKGISQIVSGILPSFVRNDKEYALWTLFTSVSEARKALEEEIAGRYPNEAILEIYTLQNRHWAWGSRPEQVKAWQALEQKYQGKAISVYPKSSLLSLRMQELEDNKASTSAQYKALYEDAKALEKVRKAYKGTEAIIAEGCRYPQRLIEQLEDSDINVTFDKNIVRVTLRNLSKADLHLYQDNKKIKTWKLTNPVNSFYVKDTVTVQVPKLADGSYFVEAVNGKLSDSDHYVQYTLSIGTRTDGNGRSVYVTDYETGVPLRTVTLRLLKGDKEVARTTMKLDGFTVLPSAFNKVLDKNDTHYYLEAQSGDRKSRTVSVQYFSGRVYYDERLRCNVYRDRGAYNPGDTVKFKAVVYNGDPAKVLAVVPNKKVEVRLKDSEDNILETKELVTNGFGSVSGEFVLPKGLRNGEFQLEVKGLAYDYFPVDEFVLPSFDLEFDKIDQLFLVGDDVKVSGRLISYSGHPLQGMKLNVKVLRYDEPIQEMEVPVADDNSFGLTFHAETSGYYHVEVTAIDPSGETLEFSKGLYVGDSISVDASVEGAADTELDLLPGTDNNGNWRTYEPQYVIESNTLTITLQVRDGNRNAVPIPVNYKVIKADGTEVATGETPSGQPVKVALPEDGVYTVVASANVQRGEKVVKDTTRIRIVALQPGNRTIGKEVQRLFVSGPTVVADGKSILARVGSSEGAAYTVITVYGKNREVLLMEPRIVADGTVDNLSIDYKASWPDAVRLQVFYFIHGEAVTYARQYRREKDRYTLPLKFTRFQDKAYPGVKYSFTLETAKDVEVLAAAWDKSLDAIASNDWPLVSLREVSVENVYVNKSCGLVGREEHVLEYRGVVRTKAAGRNGMVEEMVMAAAAPADRIADEDVVFEMAGADDAAPEDFEEVKLRDNFASALTFQPHLMPSADGTVTFELTTTDKLSTFYVRAYAHDKLMRNAMEEKEMVVTLPVKLSLLEPKFLYVGDVYEAAVTVSSAVDEPVAGVILVQAGDRMQEVPVTVGPRETLTRSFKIVVDKEGDLPIKAAFKAADFSDGVQVTVPVYPAAQVLTEAHSAVLHYGEDREALLAELRSRFVNIPGSEALLKDITVLDMVKDAIPSHVDPAGNDVLSLSEAWYIRLMATRLGVGDTLSGAFARTGSRSDAEERVSPASSDLLEKIVACKNNDGGFGWFEGMTSSPVITAVLLERFAKLRDRGFEVPDVSATVKYLDKNQFDETRPYWCGWISDAQYMHIRSYYPEVPFQVNPVTETARKRWKEFKKYAKDYLTPSAKDGRGLQGRILEKARRLMTLKHLRASSAGLELAKAWGISFSSKLDKSIEADILSLVEYAVEHRDGGWYYPNAVMPWRGLMESEAYAHALLCDLMASCTEAPVTSEVADGVRLWLMLQKETQQWDTEPAYIDAITAILDGSEAVLGTHVLALSATYKAPFAKIKAAGNGFTIDRKFFRADGSELREGDKLQVGETITVAYKIWNGENRSFVKIDAGREAALTPVQQLSGHIGYGFIRPFRGGVSFGFTPQGYRNVKAQRTEYFFDSYPEEKTTLSEEFFVTRAGVFHAPAVTIESLYAPHYRANSAGPVPVTVVR